MAAEMIGIHHEGLAFDAALGAGSARGQVQDAHAAALVVLAPQHAYSEGHMGNAADVSDLHDHATYWQGIQVAHVRSGALGSKQYLGAAADDEHVCACCADAAVRRIHVQQRYRHQAPRVQLGCMLQPRDALREKNDHDVTMQLLLLTGIDQTSGAFQLTPASALACI